MTAATTVEFTSYADRIRESDPGMWLGVLCWYTVAEAVRVPHGDLKEHMTDHGLEAFVPPLPRNDNVFKQACTNANRKRIPLGDGTFANLMVRDVDVTAGRVYKHIVVETVDGANKRLSYEPAIEVMFNPETNAIETTDLVWTDDVPECARAALAEIIQTFHSWSGCINAYTIREMFRRIIGAAGATVVRPTGGVYFVHTDRLELVDACSKLSTILSDTTFHLTPLLDDGTQRDMLRQAFTAETQGQIEKTLLEIDELIAGGGVSARKLASLVQQRKELVERTSEYSDLLSDKLTEAQLALRALDVNMRRLLKHKK